MSLFIVDNNFNVYVNSVKFSHIFLQKILFLVSNIGCDSNQHLFKLKRKNIIYDFSSNNSAKLFFMNSYLNKSKCMKNIIRNH